MFIVIFLFPCFCQARENVKYIICHYIFDFEGRLWIHAAGKVPDQATIKAMEDFYTEIYAVNGITDLKFPENYPVSRLLGTF